MRIRRLLCPVLLAVIASTVQPATAQMVDAQSSRWSVAAEAHGAVYIPVRDLGAILTPETVQLKISAGTAPMIMAGALIRTPSPRMSIRALVGFAPVNTTATPAICDVVVGAACDGVSTDGSFLNVLGQVILHPTERDVATYPYFIAGFGLRHFRFSELACGTGDFNYDVVCGGLDDFLSNQTQPVYVVGFGLTRVWGPARLRFEVSDYIGHFEGSGERGEGETQNGVSLSAGVSFPVR